mmetsp:Transcript_39265/g.117230  ORF Transcript_39265/g.117230 Transcript_39265/m.117230 type:complete len:228 (+) Transcript_39265:866-1549(+)
MERVRLSSWSRQPTTFSMMPTTGAASTITVSMMGIMSSSRSLARSAAPFARRETVQQLLLAQMSRSLSAHDQQSSATPSPLDARAALAAAVAAAPAAKPLLTRWRHCCTSSRASKSARSAADGVAAVGRLAAAMSAPGVRTALRSSRVLLSFSTGTSTELSDSAARSPRSVPPPPAPRCRCQWNGAASGRRDCRRKRSYPVAAAAAASPFGSFLPRGVRSCRRCCWL